MGSEVGVGVDDVLDDSEGEDEGRSFGALVVVGVVVVVTRVFVEILKRRRSFFVLLKIAVFLVLLVSGLFFLVFDASSELGGFGEGRQTNAARSDVELDLVRRCSVGEERDASNGVLWEARERRGSDLGLFRVYDFDDDIGRFFIVAVVNFSVLRFGKSEEVLA